jgi:hypothetical protein
LEKLLVFFALTPEEMSSIKWSALSDGVNFLGQSDQVIFEKLCARQFDQVSEALTLREFFGSSGIAVV